MRVLIIEDEALLAMELECILEDSGCVHIGTVMNKDEAVEAIDRETPDLCLVDIHLLDGPTGVDVARHAVEKGVRHVIFMTANRSRIPEDFAGAHGLIAKPYTHNGVAAALAHLKDGSGRERPASLETPTRISA